jgi:hypothetical protein
MSPCLGFVKHAFGDVFSMLSDVVLGGRSLGISFFHFVLPLVIFVIPGAVL